MQKSRKSQKSSLKPYENIAFLALGQKGVKSVKKCEKCEKVRFSWKSIEKTFIFTVLGAMWQKSWFLQNFRKTFFAKIAFSQNHYFSYRKSMILEVIFALFALLRKSAKSWSFLAQVEKQWKTLSFLQCFLGHFSTFAKKSVSTCKVPPRAPADPCHTNPVHPHSAGRCLVGSPGLSPGGGGRLKGAAMQHKCNIFGWRQQQKLWPSP